MLVSSRSTDSLQAQLTVLVGQAILAKFVRLQDELLSWNPSQNPRGAVRGRLAALLEGHFIRIGMRAEVFPDAQVVCPAASGSLDSDGKQHLAVNVVLVGFLVGQPEGVAVVRNGLGNVGDETRFSRMVDSKELSPYSQHHCFLAVFHVRYLVAHSSKRVTP